MDELGLRAAAVGLSVAASLLWLRERRRRARPCVGENACLLIPQRGPERLPATAAERAVAPRPVLRREATAGWPFRRRGAESLRIEGAGSDCHVVWRVGERAVAELVTDDELSARSLYAWLGGRFGSGAARLELAHETGTAERVVARRRAAAAPERELLLLARGGGHEVVELVGGVRRSAAHVLDPAEGHELLELLADPASGPPSDDTTDTAGRLPRTAAAALAAVFD